MEFSFLEIELKNFGNLEFYDHVTNLIKFYDHQFQVHPFSKFESRKKF